MRRCPICNRTYTDDAIMFCADDGAQLINEPAAAGPFNASAAPTIAGPPPYTPPPASSSQPAPKKRKWLAVIALAFGLFAIPFLLYSVIVPILWEHSFRSLRLDVLFLSLWGVLTVFGIALAFISVIAAIVTLGLSFKKPAQYGGRLLAVVGPVLSVLLVVLVIGIVAFRRMQGPALYASSENSNYNSNYNSNRSDNDNSASDSDSTYNSNSDSSDSDSDSDSASTDMSETEKYRLFYAAAKSGDTSLQQQAAKKIGIVDSNGMPTSTYQGFIKGTVNWAVSDRVWVQQMDTPAEGRAYALERL